MRKDVTLTALITCPISSGLGHNKRSLPAARFAWPWGCRLTAQIGNESKPGGVGGIAGRNPRRESWMAQAVPAQTVSGFRPTTETSRRSSLLHLAWSSRPDREPGSIGPPTAPGAHG